MEEAVERVLVRLHHLVVNVLFLVQVGLANDLAKEQNWLRGTDGRAYLTDFQLATRYSRRSRLFRLAAHDDLRHLLKHKRRYAPDALTAAERRVLANKSVINRVWMATVKKFHDWVAHGLFHHTDREGAGPRLVNDAPRIAERLKAHPQVREVAIVAYPDRRAGTGLYAFVEGAPGLGEATLREFIAAGTTAATAAPSASKSSSARKSSSAPKPPEHLQVTEHLPRRATGEVRSEILQLVAMNQLDLIDPLLRDDAERSLIARIVAERRNLRDRFTF